MSHAHHPDAVEENLESHPVQLVIWVVVGAIALIVGIILLVQFAIGVYGSRSLQGDPAMSEKALIERIGPVARVEFAGEAPAAPAAPVMGAPKVATVAAAPAKVDGKKVFDSICMACHATGAAGAPKFGDKAAWAPRIKTGINTLYAAALKGLNAMPPRGGNPALSDAEVKAAVDYMVAGSK
jgi:cytochrome c5